MAGKIKQRQWECVLCVFSVCVRLCLEPNYYGIFETKTGGVLAGEIH